SFTVGAGGAASIREVVPGSPAARAKLLASDAIVKINDADTTKATVAEVLKLLAGDLGTKVRLTALHLGKTEPEEVELVKANHRADAAAVGPISQLLAEIEQRLAATPRDAGLLELRAELAGQESDFAKQVADVTAAIEALSDQGAEARAADLQ